MLLKSVFTVFQGAVDSADSTLTPYLALNRPQFDPEAIPARRRYLTRRYKLLRNLHQWRKCSGERFGLGQLAQNLVSNGMLPVAEGAWDVGGEEYMLKVWNLACNKYSICWRHSSGRWVDASRATTWTTEGQIGNMARRYAAC